MTITDLDDLMMMSVPISGRTSRAYSLNRSTTPKTSSAPPNRNSTRTPRRLAYTHAPTNQCSKFGEGVGLPNQSSVFGGGYVSTNQNTLSGTGFSRGFSPIIVPRVVAGTPTPYSSRSNSPPTIGFDELSLK